THLICGRFLFLLSSRRRHTRSKRDWSSDVCSSDLAARRPTAQAVQKDPGCSDGQRLPVGPASQCFGESGSVEGPRPACASMPPRSEERRVGTEGGSAWVECPCIITRYSQKQSGLRA